MFHKMFPRKLYMSLCIKPLNRLRSSQKINKNFRLGSLFGDFLTISSHFHPYLAPMGARNFRCSSNFFAMQILKFTFLTNFLAPEKRALLYWTDFSHIQIRLHSDKWTFLCATMFSEHSPNATK